jgi:hypothetical protein
VAMAARLERLNAEIEPFRRRRGPTDRRKEGS